MKGLAFYKKLKLFFLKLARARASTLEIAWGAAIGTFISVFPTFGAGVFLVILLSKLFKFNLIVALAFSVVSNPFTSPFFLVLSYKVGAVITGNSMEINMHNWNENLGDTGMVMLLGSVIVSGTMGLIAFFTSQFVVTKIRNRNTKRT